MKKVPTLLGSPGLALEPEQSARDAHTSPARTSREQAGFLAENAAALTLIGVGAGCLSLLTARRGRDLVAEYPVATGIVAVATGVGIALALPETRIERRTVRPLARGLVEQARGLADHVRADVHTARDAVRDLRASLTRAEPSEA